MPYVVPFVETACGRIGYDPLVSGLGSTGAAGSAPGGASGTGGVSGQGGTSASFDAADDLTPPNDASGPPASCAQAGSPIRAWSFDASVEGWELSGSGTLVWAAAIGDPSPGALQLDFSGTATHPRLVQALGDLTGRIVTAEVWLDSGSGVGVKLFVQTGTRQVWADGGLVTALPGQWTCLALNIDTPVFSRQQYDPTDVQIVGFEIQASGQSRLYIDEVAY